MLIGGTLLIGGFSAPLGAVALRDQLAAGIAGGWSPWSYDGGFGDVFASNTLAEATGATYESGYFYNQMGQGQGGNNLSTVNSYVAVANNTFIDLSSTVPNGVSVTSLSIYNVAQAVSNLTIQILLENSGSSYTVVAEATKSIDTSGWQAIPLAYNVPASGTYRMGYKKPNTSGISRITSGNMAMAGVASVGGNISVITSTAGTWGNRVTYTTPPPNMTLRSAARAVPGSAGIEAALLWSQIDASTLNSEFVVDLSGDSGASWRTLSLADTGSAVSGFLCLYGRLDEAFGTSAMWRARTFNSKRQRLRGVFWRPY